MLSVLIPTYNNDLTELVNILYQQLKLTDIPFEIITIDDASKSEKNEKNSLINNIENCSFFTLKTNVGRSAIRNILIQKAQYEWVLFLDSDVMPATPCFIKNYIDTLNNNPHNIIVGGIAYKNTPDKKLLRWKLGKKREEKSQIVRNNTPYKYLLTGNFMIKKSIVENIPFNENLTQYGYEDLLFAKNLKKKKISILHIDNAVFHLGIDENKQFLQKTKKALENLSFLLKTKQISFEDTQITNIYKKLSATGLTFVLSWFTPVFERFTIFTSSFFFYNLFRLSFLAKLNK